MTGDAWPDDRDLDRIRDLSRFLDGAEPAGPAYRHAWDERAQLLRRLQDDYFWHPTSLAAELEIGVGLLADWEEPCLPDA
jgi:hypothetical protein